MGSFAICLASCWVSSQFSFSQTADEARATDWVFNMWSEVEQGVEDHPKYLHLISPKVGKENTGAIVGGVRSDTGSAPEAE